MKLYEVFVIDLDGPSVCAHDYVFAVCEQDAEMTMVARHGISEEDLTHCYVAAVELVELPEQD